jgi:SAM-dependent methyltransferase
VTPALVTWLACWGAALALLAAGDAMGLSPTWAWGAATTLGVGLALLPRAASRWRRTFMAAGFPVSALASGLAGAMPAWAWLLPLGLLLAAYPLRAWRDAPLFPTPVDGLHGLAQAVPLPAGARVMDVGCGLGHGLVALRGAYPQARVEGVEFSRLLWAAAALRCPWARVRHGDMWAAAWSGLDLVYLFQRPESMARALAKADAEMPAGSWLVSLDFAVPDVAPTQVLRRPGAQPVWIYQVGLQRRAAARGAPALLNP